MDVLQTIDGDTAPCRALLTLLRENGVPTNVSIVDRFKYPTAWTNIIHGVSVVYLPESDDAQVLFHELLHIKRQRFDRLPFVTVKPRTPEEHYFDISVLGNNLHHAFILHEEFAAYSDALPGRAEEFRQTLVNLRNKPSGIAGRDGWIAGMLFMTSQLIFPKEIGVTSFLQQGCLSLGVDPRPLMLDTGGTPSEQSLFMQFQNAVHYPAHEFVGFAQFDANQTIRRL